MAFIRIGEYIFRKSKIACIDVSSSGLFGVHYKLIVTYDAPRYVPNTEWAVPTTNYYVYYEKKCMNQLLRDTETILSDNTNCLLGKGAQSLLLHNRNRE